METENIIKMLSSTDYDTVKLGLGIFNKIDDESMKWEISGRLSQINKNFS